MSLDPNVNWAAAHDAYIRGRMSATQFYRQKLHEFCPNGELPALTTWKTACSRMGRVAFKQQLRDSWQSDADNNVRIVDLTEEVPAPAYTPGPEPIPEPKALPELRLELGNGMQLSIPCSATTDFIADLLTKLGGRHAGD